MLLLRHAAAEPFGSCDDFGRTLTDEGRRQAQLLAQKLAGEDLQDAAIIASAALRVRQTLELAFAGNAVAVDFRDELFRASESDWLDVLGRASPSTSLIMLAGHNPVIGQLASQLAGQPIAFAPCDLVVLSVAGGFPPPGHRSARLIEHWQAR